MQYSSWLVRLVKKTVQFYKICVFYISYTKPILHRPLLHIVMKKFAYHRQNSDYAGEY